MNVQEAHIAFDILLDKGGALGYPDFLPEEKDMFINKATLRVVKSKLTVKSTNPLRKDSVEETEIYYERGFCYYQLSENEKSINDFKTCIKKGYNIADSYYFIGLNLLEMDKINESYKNLYLSAKYGNQKAEEMLKDFK